MSNEDEMLHDLKIEKGGYVRKETYYFLISDYLYFVFFRIFFCHDLDCIGFPVIGAERKLFDAFILTINKALTCANFELRGCIDQYDGQVYYGVVNTVSDEQSKLGTKYTVPQIAFYKAVVSVAELACVFLLVYVLRCGRSTRLYKLLGMINDALKYLWLSVCTPTCVCVYHLT